MPVSAPSDAGGFRSRADWREGGRRARPGLQAGSRPPAARRSGWLRLLQGCLQRGEDVLGEGADLVAAGDEVKAGEAELGEAMELLDDVGGRAGDDFGGAPG